MATSGTSVFNLDIAEVIEEAFERCGLVARTGYDLRTARRSLDLISQEWSNKGINFWTIEDASVALSTAVASITLEADTVDIVEAFIRSGTSQQDVPVTRLSTSEWAGVPNKLVQGRPVNFWLNRLVTSITMHLWPVPDKSTYTFVYQKIRRIEDTGVNPGTTNPDIPTRFLPALVADLAAKVAAKRPVAMHLVPQLKLDFTEQWELALGADGERVSFSLVPGISSI
jgi:hypothetical protein